MAFGLTTKKIAAKRAVALINKEIEKHNDLTAAFPAATDSQSERDRGIVIALERVRHIMKQEGGV